MTEEEFIVSIHAPRVGRDDRTPETRTIIISFNPRAPCGARRAVLNGEDKEKVFQSTRPVWGATAGRKLHAALHVVSIHAPRVGRDRLGSAIRVDDVMFQSTRPVWGATTGTLQRSLLQAVSIHAPRVGRDAIRRTYYADIYVSIHAPRVGRDIRRQQTGQLAPGFNPRAPCGARRQLESRLPPFATYLWAFPSTNTIFSAPETHAPPAA